MSDNININELIEDVSADVRAKLAERAVERFGYTVSEAVSEAVKKHVAEHVLPSVVEEMKRRDPEIRAAVLVAFEGAIAGLAEKLRKTAFDKMTSYEGDKLVTEFVRAVFGRGY